jgi:hypothetical protein
MSNAQARPEVEGTTDAPRTRWSAPVASLVSQLVSVLAIVTGVTRMLRPPQRAEVRGNRDYIALQLSVMRRQ